MQLPYHYEQNSFEICCHSSLPKAQSISLFFYTALENEQNDAFIKPIFLAYKPFHFELMDKVSNLEKIKGIQEGETLNINQQFILLRSSKIKRWDIAVQGIFSDTTPDYKKIFPNKRTPFQNGSQTDKLNVLAALSKVLTDYPALDATNKEVELLYANINDSLTNQKSALRDTTSAAALAEVARINMCDEQYGFMGLFMSKYKKTPTVLRRYFDFNTLRHASQVLFTNSKVKPMSIHFVVKHTFHAGETVVCTNNGSKDLWFYLAKSKTEAAGATRVEVPAHSSSTVPVEQLGDLSNTYVLAYNPDDNLNGSYEFEIE